MKEELEKLLKLAYNEKELLNITQQSALNNIRFSVFREPDVDNAITQ